MKFINAKHPAICWCLLPWFIEGKQTRKEIFLELYDRLEQKPDDTFVEIALDGDMCKGVLIGYVTDDSIWIWQARAINGFRRSKEMLEHLKEWAREKNKSLVRLEANDKRYEKLYSRRYGFSKVGKIMEIAI